MTLALAEEYGYNIYTPSYLQRGDGGKGKCPDNEEIFTNVGKKD
ncbi:MAG: hypothetical protein NTZ78_04900 [Candidatus Aureabacteria bacterium]|nr:hypothetical protein [Candidatus Auribacterota bacterium]